MLERGRHRTFSKPGDGAVASGALGGSRSSYRDEESGLKDDSSKPWKSPSGSASWIWSMKHRKRRILAVVVIVGFLFAFMRYMPSMSDAPLDTVVPNIPGNRPPMEAPIREATHNDEGTEPTGKPPKDPNESGDAKEQTYSGKIRFFRLAKSLRAATERAEAQFGQQVVLFAASSTKSIATLVPMACEMAKVGKNFVHFTVNSREDVPLQSLLSINGVNERVCKVFWHDARPDYTEYSSDVRAEAAAAAALGHANQFLRPKVIITDDSISEDFSFIKGIRSRAKELRTTIIEIPKGGVDRLMWLTRLDGTALGAWHEPSVDIIVHAPKASSGSLLRLLKSLNTADYAGMKPPRLIVDLPPDIEPPVLSFLEKWQWPPRPFESPPSDNPLENSHLVVRHRLVDEKISQERASIQFLESAFPPDHSKSHVLTISPYVQLSPLFYHYTRYVLLSYLHSWSSDSSEHLFGFSLDSPTTNLNGWTDFRIPTIDDMHMEYSKARDTSAVPFLWQAPSSNALLIIGTRWREFHSFLGYRIAAQQQQGKELSGTVSKKFPSWVSYAVEFMRTRGYLTLFPGITSGESIATKHNELSQHPEEYKEEAEKEVAEKKNSAKPDPPTGDVLESDVQGALYSRASRESPLVPLSRDLLSILPLDSELPVLSALPLYTYSGDKVTEGKFQESIAPYAAYFRENIGGCEKVPPNKRRVLVPGSAKDLFCFGDEKEDEWIDDGSNRNAELLMDEVDQAPPPKAKEMKPEQATEEKEDDMKEKAKEDDKPKANV